MAIEALGRTESVLLLVVGGDADTVDDARARAERLGVAPRVLFAGTRSDIPVMMAASDVFILPSAYEANALVILEALAAGLPVIATRVGYAPEIIEDGKNGFLVEADPAEVALRLEELVASDRDALAANARASAASHGWRSTAEKYVALLTDIRALPLAGGGMTDSPLQILHVVRTRSFAGVEQFVRRLAIAQAGAGHRVAVIGGDPSADGSGTACRERRLRCVEERHP